MGLEELDLSVWRKSFIAQLVQLDKKSSSTSCELDDELDDFLAESVAELASKLECKARCTTRQGTAKPQTSKSSFGDLLLFWSYCLHRFCVCLCVCVRLVAS